MLNRAITFVYALLPTLVAEIPLKGRSAVQAASFMKIIHNTQGIRFLSNKTADTSLDKWGQTGYLHVYRSEMVTFEKLKELVFALPEVVEAPHFDKTSFRVGKKIFATLHAHESLVCVKLSAIDQDVFSSYDRSVFYPIPNKWGKLGWTYVNLKKVRKDMLNDALVLAYKQVAPVRLRKLLESAGN